MNIEVKQFWTIESSIREVFTRLVTIEAVLSLKAMANLPPSSDLYPRYITLSFRTISAAGAAGLWFNGSWWDMLVAGFLAIIVALFEGSTLWKHERMIFEVFAAFVVGALAGFITISWKEATCFQAIAVASVIDILQGFRVVYSIMEVRLCFSSSVMLYFFWFKFRFSIFQVCSTLHISNAIPDRS